MKTTTLSFFSLGLIGLSLHPVSGMEPAKPAIRPNILLIMADDMGYSDIGCFGSEIKTPNLDKLAQQGVRFSQFYNASRCCPTRASLLTGLYQHQAGVGDMVNDLGVPAYQGYLNTTSVTMGEVMKMNGYNTYMSGKWHVGNRPETLPRKRGFDRYFGLIDGAGSYFERIPYRTNQQAPRMMLDDADYDPPKQGFYFTNAITDYALQFLEEEKQKKEPFFMYLAYTAPHWPLHALPDDIAKYRGKYMKGWDVLRKERFERMKKMGLIEASCQLSPRDVNSPEWDSLSPEDQKMWDLRMAVYAAMIDRLDQNIGRMVTQLEKMGELNNTLIIFLSDNGGCHEGTKNKGSFIRTTGETGTADSFDAYEFPWANVSNTPFRMHKHWVHEGGISTPFIAFYPEQIKGGKLVHQPGHITDLMTTFIDYAGGKYPETFNGNPITPMEGVSLKTAFSGKKMKREQPIFWEHEGNRAMRDGDWKLVSQYNYGQKKFLGWELYNLKNDRSELNDLSAEQADRKKQMIQEYENWADRVGVVSKEKLDKR
ncbi:MAG: arylsulfatase [Bacteroidota bacterium]|nr:arylsulfatase [Bacteroidota bacterium]